MWQCRNTRGSSAECQRRWLAARGWQQASSPVACVKYLVISTDGCSIDLPSLRLYPGPLNGQAEHLSQHALTHCSVSTTGKSRKLDAVTSSRLRMRWM